MTLYGLSIEELSPLHDSHYTIKPVYRQTRLCKIYELRFLCNVIQQTEGRFLKIKFE